MNLAVPLPVACLVTLIAGSTACVADPGRPSPGEASRVHKAAEGRQLMAGIDTDIGSMIDELGLPPGLAVAVVVGDSVVYEGTFGYGDIDRQISVTRDTRFYIASVTKSFVAAAARVLAVDSVFNLEASLAETLPVLRLSEPLDAAHISIRDLLTHRSGIENRAATSVSSYLGPEDEDHVLRLLSSSEPATREFRYTNLGYLLTGYAMERAAGRRWQDLVRDLVLLPLGMENTTFSFQDIPADELALPYSVEVDDTRLLRTKSTRTMHAAGGMVSTLADMTTWLRVHMNGGRLGEVKVFDDRLVADLHAPQISLSGSFGGFRRYAYGLGWYLADYDGLRVVQCFGSYAGYRAHVSFMPERGIGVVVLQNEGRAGVFLPDYIAQAIYDRFVAPDSAVQRQESRTAQYKEIIALVRGDQATPDLQLPPPPHRAGDDLEAHTGLYDGGDLGTLRLSIEEGALFARWGDLSSYLLHEGDDAFMADFTPGSVEDAHSLRFERSARRATVAVHVEFGRTYRFDRIGDDRTPR